MYDVARVLANAERQQDHGVADVQGMRAEEKGGQQSGRRDLHAGRTQRVFASLLQPSSARRPRGRTSVVVFGTSDRDHAEDDQTAQHECPKEVAGDQSFAEAAKSGKRFHFSYCN